MDRKDTGPETVPRRCRPQEKWTRRIHPGPRNTEQGSFIDASEQDTGPKIAPGAPVNQYDEGVQTSLRAPGHLDLDSADAFLTLQGVNLHEECRKSREPGIDPGVPGPHAGKNCKKTRFSCHFRTGKTSTGFQDISLCAVARRLNNRLTFLGMPDPTFFPPPPGGDRCLLDSGQ